jgi:hypothetical protein
MPNMPPLLGLSGRFLRQEPALLKEAALRVRCPEETRVEKEERLNRSFAHKRLFDQPAPGDREEHLAVVRVQRVLPKLTRKDVLDLRRRPDFHGLGTALWRAHLKARGVAVLLGTLTTPKLDRPASGSGTHRPPIS